MFNLPYALGVGPLFLHLVLSETFLDGGVRVNSLRAHSALVLHEQTRTAATRFVWTAVILSSSKTVDHFKQWAN